MQDLQLQCETCTMKFTVILRMFSQGYARLIMAAAYPQGGGCAPPPPPPPTRLDDFITRICYLTRISLKTTGKLEYAPQGPSKL
jgi:hypothetical protein